MPHPEYLLDSQEYHKRAAKSAVIGGVIFGTGWLVYIDAAATGMLREEGGARPVAITAVPLVIATIFVVMLNAGVDLDSFRSARFDYGWDRQLWRRRSWVYLSGAVGFGAIAGAVALLLWDSYTGAKADQTLLAGTAVTSSNLIFLSAMVFWIGRGHGTSVL
mmetsp:Transcript_52144/g.124219  ORF Transcript_52144/g.124219 Transcript_52144/m.124219 type:complete len:162 (+) Transcript_52144:224-709(+)